MIPVDSQALEQTGEDAPVEVNQRALIDKVLARYSGEFTLFRELLQNSDDAGSDTAEIHFATTLQEKAIVENKDPRMLPDIKSTPVVQWLFRNNGNTFTKDDWERLPKIAQGNPKPEKIGAFGVGFYSLFSVTESPFVSSGGCGMQFYWKGDTLHVRRGNLPPKETLDPWTTFVMPLREAFPMPPPLDLMRFLASSITFMVNLEKISVFFDDHRIGHIKKLPELSRTVELPVELRRASPERDIMHVKSIQSHRIIIEAEVVHTVYTSCKCENPDSLESLEKAKLVDCMATETSRVALTIFTLEADVKVDEKLLKELYRCTKKKPPSALKYSLIYTGKNEYDQSRKKREGCEFPSIFQGLRADLEGGSHTRIFIGHATGQTTGIGGHMASYFIPTVERESIDLVDRNISVWNRELLYVGGFLCRAVYELELSDIQASWEAATTDSRPSLEIRVQTQLQEHFLHVLRFFTFLHSTPSPKVSQLLEKSFYECSTMRLRLLSSVGVREAPEIRTFDPVYAKFLKSLPMLSEYVSQHGKRTITALPDQHKIPSISFEDVLDDLRKHTLSEEELISCFEWWVTQKEVDPASRMADLLNVAAVRGSDGIIRQLSSIRYFVDSKGLGTHMPPDGPLPESLIPLNISKHFSRTELTSLGWREFTVGSWLKHISSAEVMSADPKYDFTQSVEWAGRVLVILSRVWPTLPEETRRMAMALFSKRNCIPTTCGLRPPENSYLPMSNLNLFHDLDLPIVQFTPGIEIRVEMEPFLVSIGVRRHAPPEILLDRLVDIGYWSIVDLIAYLVQVQNTLSQSEFSKLESSAAFMKEEPLKEGGNRSRYLANELYPPLEIFRQLQLPVIDWGKRSKWLNESDEAELLYRLGLRRYPLLETVIDLCSSTDANVRGAAFTYLCENLRSKYPDYNSDKFREVEFIPAENNEGPCLKKLGDVFSGAQWKSLGFSVVQNAYQKVLISEIGVQQHPPSSMLLDLLEASWQPPTEDIACQWFECLSQCISSFTQSELNKISELAVVPVNRWGTRKWLTPAQCYLGVPTDEFHDKLFVFVNLSPGANHFLSACGSKNEPSVKDIAESLIDDPQRFHDLAGGPEGFLAKLRDLSARSTRIPNITLNKMSLRSTLLGLRRKESDSKGGWEHVHELRRPDEIVIVDDFRDYELFSDFIFAAPQEETLERFYTWIGCRRLSTAVQEKYDDSDEISDPKTCTDLQNLVLARLPLFLQKCTHTKPKIPVPSTPEEFRVRVCKRLHVTKTLTIGDCKTSRTQDVWATTKYEKQGMELWLSRHAKADMYEVAASLCRLLFGTAKVSDTLLLGTILSTDPDVLKRTGYNVDQIAKGQPQDRSREPAANTNSHNEPRGQGSVLQLASFGLPMSAALSNVRDAYHDVKRRLVSSVGSQGTVSLSSWPSKEVISQNYIRRNVDEAINACGSGGKLLDSKDEVIRFLNNQYCNDSRRVGSLRSLDVMEGMEIHVAEGVSLADTFIQRKQAVLTRFIGIIKLIAFVYNLPLTSLHIFYDVPSGPIAFNQKGSIYLNMRYFEEWHDEDVQADLSNEAQISWFFALAHEIAHNLISTHDSAHEFWVSAICEAHIGTFSKFLRPESLEVPR